MAEVPKTPVITGISFPATIPGNKSTIMDLLYFTAPDGGMKHITYEVISAEKFGSEVDDNPKLDSDDWTNGAIKIYLWCEGEQSVTLRATMYDWAENHSNSMGFSFTCK